MNTFSKPTVLVLAGTKWQIPLIQRLEKEGCRVVVFNSQPDSPAFPYADDYRIADILNRKRCLELAREYMPEAVLSDECDIAVPTAAFLSEELGLVSIGTEMGELYTNKYKMRLFGRKNGLDTPCFYKCSDLEETVKIFRNFGKKMILKPLDANSSRGVYSIVCEDDIRQHFKEAVSFSKTEQSVLLEEYIEGTEFTVDGIKTEKGHFSLAVSEKQHYAYNENIANCLCFSHRNSRYDYDKLREINDRFVALSGLPFGLTHAEYKYKEGRFYLMEIGARGGGNRISSCIVPVMSGVDTQGYLIHKVLGRECNETVKISKEYQKRCAVLGFFDIKGKEGIVKKIQGETYLRECEWIIDYGISCREGDFITRADNDSQRVGYYIAYGEKKEILKRIIDQVEEKVQIVLEESF